jgi:hypothetical protein
MKMKIKPLVFLAFIAISSGFVTFMGTGLSAAETMAKKFNPENPGTQKNQKHQVIAYYFHSTFRCTTCLAMEELTKEAILTGFPEELKSGRLVLKVINFDEEQNNHFIKDYDLSTKSVVIVDMKGGAQIRWKNLVKIWDLMDSKEAFLKYIQEETRSYLGNG